MGLTGTWQMRWPDVEFPPLRCWTKAGSGKSEISLTALPKGSSSLSKIRLGPDHLHNQQCGEMRTEETAVSRSLSNSGMGMFKQHITARHV
jgi:hypothetical protein